MLSFVLIRVVSSSMWKESEEKFKWKKDRQFSELFIKYESSQNLLETVSDEGSSIVTELIDLILVRWSMIFVMTVNLILDPCFVLESSSLEIVPKETISLKHFMQTIYQRAFM